jgi:hypothetical protein
MSSDKSFNCCCLLSHEDASIERKNHNAVAIATGVGAGNLMISPFSFFNQLV